LGDMGSSVSPMNIWLLLKKVEYKVSLSFLPRAKKIHFL